MKNKYTHSIIANTEDGPVLLCEENGSFSWASYDEPGKRFTLARAMQIVTDLQREHDEYVRETGNAEKWLFRIRVVERKPMTLRERLQLQKEREREREAFSHSSYESLVIHHH